MAKELEIDGVKFLGLVLEPPPLADPADQNEYIYDIDYVQDSHHDPAYFEGAEHEQIAERLKLRDVDGNELPMGAGQSEFKATLQNTGEKLGFTFGRIIALAGDHYSSYNDKNRTPICGAYFGNESDEKGMEDRFESMVESFVHDKDGFLAALNAVLDKECGGVKKVIETQDSVKMAYHTHTCGIPTDKEFYDAAAYPFTFGLSSLYSWLALINADHFCDDAVTAYSVGHGLALKFAKEAHDVLAVDKARAKQLLIKAYYYDAFAAHFLTDLFSAGHIRTPRRHLHCSNSKYMTLTKLIPIVKERSTDAAEKPVWDHQNRYMHDDDCATGLLVRNQKGNEWIAYGDKQFFEPSNRMNRRMAQIALQASADEIYERAFLRGEHIQKKDFDAIRTAPTPMLSVVGKPWVNAWGGYEMHNPAPLWKAMIDQSPDTKEWTYRRDIGDHSYFDRDNGPPGETTLSTFPEVPLHCQEIFDHPFRGDDQFVRGVDSSTIGDIKTGGFVQVQNLKPDSTQRICLNVWGPVRVRLTDDSSQKETVFTIRNRVIDADTLSDDTTPLTWTKYFDGKHTKLIRWDYRGGSVSASVFGMDDTQPQILDFEKVYGKGDTKVSIKKLSSSTIAGLSIHQQNLNYTRFLLGSFAGQENGAAVAAVVPNGEGKLQVAIIAGPADDGKFAPVANWEWDSTLGELTFIKPFSTTDGQKILVASIQKDTAADKAILLDIALIRFKDGSLSRSQCRLDFPLKVSKISSLSMLVGDIWGSGGDHAALIHSEASKPRIRTYGAGDHEDLLALTGTHDCTREIKDHIFVQHHFTALLDSSDGDEKGSDLLQVSVWKKSSEDYRLIFWLHQRASNKHSEPGPEKDNNPWGNCVMTYFKDSFYGKYQKGKGPYFSIKWLRCSVNNDRNAIMEVYSWYGVLGYRVFKPNKKGEFSEVGKVPFMGQTSIGAGLGITGDWGHGILPWGETEEFKDVNVWTPDMPKNGPLDPAVGSFGIRPGHSGRPLIHGWDVKGRPW